MRYEDLMEEGQVVIRFSSTCLFWAVLLKRLVSQAQRVISKDLCLSIEAASAPHRGICAKIY